MPGRRGHRLQRQRFFVACEGDSEMGYAALLQRRADEARLPIHLDIRKYRGGDPLKIVEKAVEELISRGKRRGPYRGQAIFFDADRRDDSPSRTSKADRFIVINRFLAIWSQPAYEALLLKHIPGCEHLRPATTALALQQLQDHWPGYHKGMTVSELHSRVDLSAIKRAAVVIPHLRRFLLKIGLLE